MVDTGDDEPHPEEPDDEIEDGLSEEFPVHHSPPGTAGPNHFGSTTVEIKKRQSYKRAVMSIWGNPETGEVRRKSLDVATFPPKPTGGFDFDDPTKHWSCSNDEIVRLKWLLEEHFVSDRYRIVDVGSRAGDLVRLLENNPDAELHVLGELSARTSPALLAQVLQQTAAGQGGAELAVIERRRAMLDRLELLLSDPATTERDLHPILKREWWIFGGRFVASLRTDLITLDTHDLALLEADGSLHIIELKGPNIPALVRKPREHWTVGSQVHWAAMQAANYIRGVDEEGGSITTLIRNELNLDVDLRRVFATVVIGHPDYVTPDPTRGPRAIDQALRTYNAHISRVEVMTYEFLLSTARRSLALQPRADD
jgi:hypothetical protein